MHLDEKVSLKGIKLDGVKNAENKSNNIWGWNISSSIVKSKMASKNELLQYSQF